MRIGSLFTGYGGLDMAVQSVLGGEVAWYSEIDKHACTVLAAHYPGVPNLGDVTRIDWTTVEPVDVLTGGYPCQPFSHAGQRKGTDDERHLWPFIADAIRSGVLRRGGVAVFENVDGHRSLGLADVLGDLACMGMSARWGVVRAADAGAPHGRKRVFIVAHAEGGRWGARSGSPAAQAGRVVEGTGDGGGASAHAGSSGLQRCSIQPASAGRSESWRVAVDHRNALPANTNGCGWAEGVQQPRHVSPQDRAGSSAVLAGHRADGIGPRTDWGKYGRAVHRWEHITRPAPEPTIPGPTGRPRLSPAFVEWMMGLPEGHVTGHGLKPAACLKMLGNGVVPQQAALALRLLGVGPC